MSLKDKLNIIWNNRGNIGTITEGMFNAYVACGPEVKEEALRRLALCRTNQCGYHDPHGQSPKALFKGKESCGGCGCDLYAKGHAMSAHCYLKDLQIQMFRGMIMGDKFTPDVLSAEQASLARNYSDAQIWDLILQIEATGIQLQIGPAPLWGEVLTAEEEKQISEIAYRKQMEAWEKQQNQQSK